MSDLTSELFPAPDAPLIKYNFLSILIPSPFFKKLYVIYPAQWFAVIIKNLSGFILRASLVSRINILIPMIWTDTTMEMNAISIL